jgi:acyl transferase domain-containing protein
MNITHEIPIGMVSNHLQSVVGDESLSPAKATVLGACKVIPQEYPALRCRSIDVSLEEGKDRPTEWLAGRLITELTIEPFSSSVAYRKGLRWVQDFESLSSSEAHATANVLRESGVYLITGGLGNIGLVLAEYLASKVRAKLVLLGRSAFPERDEWEQWLSTHGEDEVTRKIRRLGKLEELGAEIMVVRADASNLEELRPVVDRIYKRFGDLNGVIHGAGNVGPGSDTAVNQTDQAACDQHFTPKVKGLLVLEEAVRGRKLDFCLLLSSLSSVLGGLGFVAYSAANNFMDGSALTGMAGNSRKTGRIFSHQQPN